MYFQSGFMKFKPALCIQQLPYYDDGKVKLAQSKAILRYLSRKYKLGMCIVYLQILYSLWPHV